MTHRYLWTRSGARSGSGGPDAWRRRLSPGTRLCACGFALAVLLLLTAPVHGLWASRDTQTPIQDAFPSYVGLNTIHVAYTYDSMCGAACRRDLEVVLPDMTVEVLTTLNAGATTGSFLHDGLPPGKYGYYIVETRLADDLVINTTTLREGTIDGLTIGGRLLYDEALHQEFACANPGGVTLSDGVDLTLDGVRLISNCWITLEGSAALSAQDSEFVGGALTISGAGTVDIIGSTFTPVLLTVGSDVAANISLSRVLGEIQLAGAARHLRLHGNHFADVVRLLTRSAVSFEDNLFLYPIILDDRAIGAPNTWCQDNGLSPTIAGNSFLGSTALTYSISGCSVAGLRPVAVGANYYGDPQGPVYGQAGDDPVVPGITYGRAWLQRGATVYPNLFRLDPALKSGRQWQDAEVFPAFWVNGYRLGQHTITNQITDLMRGKESLFTVDLVTSHESVAGAKVWAVWNGLPVEPASPLPSSLKLVRDPGRSAVVLRSANSTIDFFLPPTEGVSATLELWLDTRSLTGFADAGASGEVKKLVTLPVPLKAPPPVVGIHIVPVTIDHVTASTGALRTTLESATPAMLPVASTNLRVSATGYSPAWRSAYIPTALLLNAVATDLVRYRGAMRYDPQEFPKGELMDFVVGVMPAGSLGGGDGVYMNLRHNIVLVDETKPEAVFHELGHAIGLYNLREQYNWPNYPPNGRPVEGHTFFLNQPTTSNGTINNVFMGDPGRVLHTAAPGQWWHDSHLVVVDVMGNTAPFWPHPATLQSFTDYFYSLAAEPRPPVARSLAADPDVRRVVVSVETERVEVTETSWSFGERRCAAYRPLIETARLFPRDAFTDAAGEPGGEPDVTHGALPLCLTAEGMLSAPGDIDLCLMPIGEDGDIMPEYYTCRRVLAPEEVNTARRHDVAVLFFDVPVSAARYSLVTTRQQASPLVLTGSTALDVDLLAPSAGQTLTETVTLKWKAQATPRDPSTPAGQPLLHQVSYSSDGGATWSPVGLPVEGDAMVLSTDFLPSGDLALRVTVSDGFLTSADQVTELYVPLQPPDVIIHSPRNGDRAAPGYAWFLQAWAQDYETRAPATGSWRSSLDGALGSGAALDAVDLSAGTHVLTYAVTGDSGGSAEAHVTVTVEATPGVDLAMAPDALAVAMPWRDPVVVQAPRLRTGTPQTATLKLRNTGVPVTATLQLYVLPPGAAELLIAQETLNLAPFETRRIGGVFTATVAGVHRFRGVVTAQDPLDYAPGNNERRWEITAVSSGHLVPSAAAVAFVAPAGMPVDRTITLANAGGLGLIVQRAALDGDAASPTGFQFWSDNCSGVALAPAEACTVTLRYTPTAGVEEEALLKISSTDPDQPEQEVVLTGKVGTLVPDLAHVYLPLVVR